MGFTLLAFYYRRPIYDPSSQLGRNETLELKYKIQYTPRYLQVCDPCVYGLLLLFCIYFPQAIDVATLMLQTATVKTKLNDIAAPPMLVPRWMTILNVVSMYVSFTRHFLLSI